MNSNGRTQLRYPLVFDEEYGRNIVAMHAESTEIRAIVNGKDLPFLKLTFEISADSCSDEVHAFVTDWFSDLRCKVIDLLNENASIE